MIVQLGQLTFISSTFQQSSTFLQFHKPLNGHKVVVYSGNLSFSRLPGCTYREKREVGVSSGQRAP